MTWTAGQLVNELRHLDPDTDVYIVAGPPNLERMVRRRRWFQRARRCRIIRARVVRFHGGQYAYIEGE